MIATLAAIIVFFAAAPDSVGPADCYVYNRALEKPTRNLVPKHFLTEDITRQAIFAALMRWGRRELAPHDDPWVIDIPFAMPRLKQVTAACDSTTELGDLYLVPQEELHPLEQGRVQSYVLVRRARGRSLPPLDPPALRLVDGQCVVTTRKR